MGYAFSFSPWIVYGVASAASNWRVGVIGAAGTQAALAVSLARKRQLDLLAIGTLTFFAAMSVVALVSPDSPLHRWLAPTSTGALAAISVASLLAGRPFTLAIARRTTPESLWSHPEFIRINRFLTAVWASAFTATAAAGALVIATVRSDALPLVAVNLAGVLIAFYITGRTVKSAQSRAAAAGLV